MGSDDLSSSTLTSPPRSDAVAMSPGYVLVGRYRIDTILGRGGMGAVFSATQINTGLTVAIKVLHPEFSQRTDLVRRFAGEARAAASLRHPGIVRVIDFDRDGALHFLVMEKLEGESLADRINRAGPLPEALVAQLGADICDAVSAAHRCTPRIVHRDLKPENVFLATEGRHEGVVKILDFGVAKLIDPDQQGPGSLTVSGVVAGTPCYMAPEQLLSSRDVDERSDLYSIGVILFQALTKSLPHDASSLGELILKVHSEPAPPLVSVRPEVSPQLAAVVDRALARNRQERFQTADELRAALEAVLAGTAPIPPRAGRPSTTRRRLMKLAPLGLLAAGGLGVWWSTPASTSAMGPTRPRDAALGLPTSPVGVTPAARTDDGGAQANAEQAIEVIEAIAVPPPPPAETPKKRSPSTRLKPEESPPAGATLPTDERPKFRE